MEEKEEELGRQWIPLLGGVTEDTKILPFVPSTEWCRSRNQVGRDCWTLGDNLIRLVVCTNQISQERSCILVVT